MKRRNRNWSEDLLQFNINVKIYMKNSFYEAHSSELLEVYIFNFKDL